MGRLSAVSPLFEAGNVFLPEARWTADFVEELTRFPNTGNDDQVDACTQALLYLPRQSSRIMEYYRELAEKAKGRIG